ncbi:hypothetical protein SH611_04470 [Geminicoccaceae bacterium 1502E]|nr:hypothetical protein [Geminicoccaceae bacterium 1502E]
MSGRSSPLPVEQQDGDAEAVLDALQDCLRGSAKRGAKASHEVLSRLERALATMAAADLPSALGMLAVAFSLVETASDCECDEHRHEVALSLALLKNALPAIVAAVPTASLVQREELLAHYCGETVAYVPAPR